MLLTVGPVLVSAGISASGHQLSLLLFANADIIGLAPSALNHLPTLRLLILFSSFFASVPNAVVRPREALLGRLLTILAFKPALALFAGFSQYFVF